MADLIRRKKGDTSPWPFTLLDNGSAKDLTNATTLEIYVREEDGSTNKIDGGTVTVVSALAGTCEYDPASGDVDTPGEYQGYIKVEFSDGSVWYWPDGDDFFEVIIGPNFE